MVQRNGGHRRNKFYSDRHVTLCPERLHGDHRTGNHLFLFAAAVYLASKTNRTVAMPTCGWPLDRTFQMVDSSPAMGRPPFAVVRYADGEPPCPCRSLRPSPERPYNGDDRFDSESGLAELRRSRLRTLSLCGLYQTHRYPDAIGSILRRLLQFRPEVRHEADIFREETRPDGWKPASYFRIGIHVRRGDFMRTVWLGNDVTTVIDGEYIDRALDFFLVNGNSTWRRRYSRFQLVVATDDWHWTRRILEDKFSSPLWTLQNVSRNIITTATRKRSSALIYRVDVTQSSANGSQRQFVDVSVAFSDETRSAAVDLAVLAGCDAVIMSTGSFSWWAAWLSNTTVVYYDKWPRPVPLTKGGIRVEYDNALYFPQRWIPLH